MCGLLFCVLGTVAGATIGHPLPVVCFVMHQGSRPKGSLSRELSAARLTEGETVPHSGRQDESALWRVLSPTGYFFLGEKVPKTPPKPRWFRTFSFLALAHADHQKERIFVSCFSYQDPSYPTSPAGPRRHRLQKRFAASALADGRNCAVVNSTTQTRHSKAKAATDFPTAKAGERRTFGLRAAFGGWPHKRPPAGG